MGIFGCSGALRALMLAFGLLWLAPAAQVSAGTLLSPGGAVLIKKSIEPFGRATAILSEGGLRDKWLGLQRRLADDLVQLALCEGDRDGCVSPAALKFLAVVDDAKVRDGRGRLGEVNRAVNLAIRPADDLVQYGAIDVWASPLMTFANGAGDCEDYAIAKFVALRLAGMAAEDLRIVIMHDTLRGEDHAVTAARLDDQWLTLDNRRMMMVADSDVRNYRSTFVIDEAGVRRYTDMPLVAEAALH
ncbi:transglutaminase-like cysteine peptidase [Bradyrhizobium sp. Ai1a-2]|uniref:transglutaminase-like cysteine peptidase n=1 Tax=Bradyrhizobium sp. Ai1a-2 TaxID=196490 RepID=UPI000483F9FA|nr:transglutaminase-like cysteine peptidase [Bradyrhizobium sp. Ai1a-2]